MSNWNSKKWYVARTTTYRLALCHMCLQASVCGALMRIIFIYTACNVHSLFQFNCQQWASNCVQVQVVSRRPPASGPAYYKYKRETLGFTVATLSLDRDGSRLEVIRLHTQSLTTIHCDILIYHDILVTSTMHYDLHNRGVNMRHEETKVYKTKPIETFLYQY